MADFSPTEPRRFGWRTVIARSDLSVILSPPEAGEESKILRSLRSLRMTFVSLTVILFFSSCAPSQMDQNRERLNQVQSWFALLNYDSTSSVSIPWQDYDMAILDPDYHPPLPQDDTLLFAYISLGEAESYRKYWPQVVSNDWLIAENPNWKDNYYVDVRRPEWRNLILHTVIPEIIEKGFSGLFLDTLDTAEYLEGMDPEEYAGSKAAMAALVGAIHETYPELMLVSNNGFGILDAITPYLSGVLAEDLHGRFDFDSGRYVDVPPSETRQKLLRLQAAGRLKIPVFVIDYAAVSDEEKAREYRDLSLKAGFKPYIAQTALDQIAPAGS